MMYMIYSYNTDWVLINTNFGGVLPTEVARILRRRIYFGRLKTYLAVVTNLINSQPYKPQKWNCNMILMFFSDTYSTGIQQDTACLYYKHTSCTFFLRHIGRLKRPVNTRFFQKNAIFTL